MNAHEERLLAHTRSLRERAVPGSRLAPEIHASWLRCSTAGMTLDLVPDIPVVADADLRRRRDRAGLVRQLALAELETLSQQIAGSNFLLAFGDRDGVILDLCADHRFATSSSGAGIQLGSCWGEDLCGTNGLGTALAAGRPVAVNGPEHYLTHFGDISCTASPIHDAWGQVVGVLDASSYFESRQRHTQALVQMATAHIENLLLAHQMRDGLVLAIHPRAEFLDTLSAGLMAFDEGGTLRTCNARTPALLAGLSLAPGTAFEALFELPFDHLLHQLRHGRPVPLRDAMGSALVASAQGRSPALHRGPPAPTALALAAPAAAEATLPPRVRSLTHIAGQPYLADDAAVAEALRTVAAAVRLKAPLLIHGDTGTGKEQLARHAHEASGRSGAFVAVNCGALPAELFEAELFGHAPGAFTGARREGNPGLIVAADGGTLLLDELRELPPALQPALLRFLDDQLVRPVGGSQTRRVDVQIVAATHADLDAEVVAGRFRADLMYRLNTVRVRLPALRDRQDFTQAAWQVLRGIAPQASLTDEAVATLAGHDWPGNFRELRAVLTRALLARADSAPRLEAAEVQRLLPPRGTAPARGHSALQLSAAELVLREFERTGGCVSQTSRNLGISRTTVYRHLRAQPPVPSKR
jgi:transcriptional regulator of acetoin/glycerol metabolism